MGQKLVIRMSRAAGIREHPAGQIMALRREHPSFAGSRR